MADDLDTEAMEQAWQTGLKEQQAQDNRSNLPVTDDNEISMEDILAALQVALED